MKKILVIDDSEIILESTSMLLKFAGYDVFTAISGEDGLSLLDIHHPDLILCDIAMPGKNGFEILDIIRANTISKSTPFIFLTVFTEKTNIKIGMEKGADGFLQKPYTKDDLLSIVEAQFKKTSIIDERITKRVSEVGKNITYALPHEFRTALNQIVNSAKYLLNQTDLLEKDDIKELSKDIIDSADRLVIITENYIAYSEIVAISQNPDIVAQLLNYKTVEPSVLINEISSEIAVKYGRLSDLQISVSTNGLAVKISSENFFKIINELIDNAFKFSLQGTPLVIGSVLEDNYFVITIEDKGRGMTLEQIENIGALVQFERDIYEQQGMGLGLVIAQKVVELHNGMFIIDSKLNEGTKITVKLLFEELN